MPAHDLERIVVEGLLGRLEDCSQLVAQTNGSSLQEQLRLSPTWSDRLRSAHPQDLRAAILELVERIEVRPTSVMINLVGGEAPALEADAAKIRTGKEVRLVIAGSEDEAEARRNGKLVALLARAHAMCNRIIAGESLAAIARSEDSSPSSIGRTIRIGLLAPDIVTAAVEGRQPATLTRSSLWKAAGVPLDWPSQRKMLGFS